MKLDTRLDALLSEWESHGGRRTPEELCSSCADLLPELRLRIRSLASADALLGGGQPGRTLPPPPAEPPQIPGYEFHDVIGYGGMGVVWRATQRSTRRAVAVKTIGAALLGSPRAQRRFEDEVAFAARLAHPNIARVYDSGVHAGLFYYAMEYVEGVPLDEYVRARSPSRRQRIELIETACRAVHHAHQRGIIHRDLKPSNIMVTADGRPVLLDFGLAKELRQAGASGVTLENAVPGTPAYMSPEQADGRARDVDVRSDVYSLGVVLYETLCGGRSPYGTPADSGELLARARLAQVERPRRVDPGIPTDLEAVMVKALERLPADRYGSTDALADDLRAFLDARPVKARPANAWYVARKWLSRNRRVASMVAAVLALFVTVAAVAAVKLARQRAQTETQRAISEATLTFLLDRVLTANDPAVAQGHTPELRELLDRASAEVGTSFAQQPLVEAAVRTTLGKIYINLGDGVAAESHLRSACKLYREAYGTSDLMTQASEFELAYCLESIGKGREAQAMFLSLLDRRRERLGEAHPDTLACMHRLANVLIEYHELDEAAALLEKAYAGRRAALGESHPDTIWSMSDLGTVYLQQGRYAEAEPLQRGALRLRMETQGPRHIDTLNAHYNLSGLLRRTGRLDEAAQMLIDNAARRREVYGPEHVAITLPVHALAVVRLQQGRHEDAVALASSAYDLRHAQDRLAGRGSMQSLSVCVRALAALGREDEARARFAAAAPHLQVALDRGDVKWVDAYAMALAALGDPAGARELRSRLGGSGGPDE